MGWSRWTRLSLTSCVLPSGAFDLVHVAFDFEHVEARPYGCITGLKDTMHVVSSEAIAALFERQRVRPRRQWTVPLNGGKRFDVCEYARPDKMLELRPTCEHCRAFGATVAAVLKHRDQRRLMLQS